MRQLVRAHSCPDQTLASAADGFLQRAGNIARWLTETDVHVAALEDELKRAQRTKQAKEYLASQAEVVKEEEKKVETVEKGAKTVSPVVEKKQKTEAKKATAAAAIESERERKVADLEAQLASEQANAAEAGRLNKSVAEEQLQRISALESQLSLEKAKAEEAAKANKGLVDAESKLRDEQERLVQSVTELNEANAELVKKIDEASKSDAALQTEVAKLQAFLKEMEDTKSDNDTNFRKLWKTIDEFQVGYPLPALSHEAWH